MNNAATALPLSATDGFVRKCRIRKCRNTTLLKGDSHFAHTIFFLINGPGANQRLSIRKLHIWIELKNEDKKISKWEKINKLDSNKMALLDHRNSKSPLSINCLICIFI